MLVSLLLGLLVFISPGSYSLECDEAYDKALQSCKQPLSDADVKALSPENSSHAEAQSVSERLLIKVQEKVFECGFALRDCSEICQHTGQIVERVGGYAQRADEFFDKQTACEPEGELHAYLPALEATRQQSLSLWQSAGHNADLVNALDLTAENFDTRSPAQAPASPLGPPIQVLPTTLDTPTHPSEYSRQVERALGYIK